MSSCECSHPHARRCSLASCRAIAGGYEYECECDCHYAPGPAPKPASLTIANVNRAAGPFTITYGLPEDELAEARRAFEESLHQIQEGHAILLQDEPDPYADHALRDQLGAKDSRIRELEAEVGRLSLELRKAERRGRK